MTKLKSLLLIVFLTISFSGFGQAMWILIFGDKLSTEKLHSGITVSAAGVDLYGFQNAKMAPNWAIGGFMDLSIFKKKSLVFSLDFTFKTPLGARNMDNFLDDIINDSINLVKESVVLNNTAFSLPLYFKYKTKYAAFGAGIQMTLIYKSTFKYTAQTDDKKTIRISKGVNKKLNKFDIGPFVMFEFYLKPSNHLASMRLGMRYFYGLLQPVKNEKGIHNATLMATLCIPIGGKKTMIKEEQE
jgi:hypothetical protein